jgi:hypothetical protein
MTRSMSAAVIAPATHVKFDARMPADLPEEKSWPPVGLSPDDWPAIQ